MHLNCCHLMGKTKHRLGCGRASGSRVQVPGWEPRLQPKDREDRTESRPLCASGQGYCGPTCCLCENQRNKPLPKQALSLQEPASSLLQRAFILTPSPKFCFSLSFFLIQVMEIPLYKTKSGPLSSWFSLTAIPQHAFQRPSPERWSVLPDPKFSQKTSKLPQNLICTLHPSPSPLHPDP